MPAAARASTVTVRATIRLISRFVPRNCQAQCAKGHTKPRTGHRDRRLPPALGGHHHTREGNSQRREVRRMTTAGRTRSGGVAAGAGRTARRGLWGLARIVNLVTAVVVGLLVVGILLVVLEANKSNDVVNWLLDAARFLAGPLDYVFKFNSHKVAVAVNWGLAGLIY